MYLLLKIKADLNHLDHPYLASYHLKMVAILCVQLEKAKSGFGMKDLAPANDALDFVELESRFGRANAVTILRTLEQFEGVVEARVTKLSCEDRLKNVFRLMKENMRYQTRH